MKKFSIYTRLNGEIFNDIIEGHLHCSDGYYYICDKDNKSHYYPICCTIIREL